MSSRIGVVPTRVVATLIALTFAVCLLGVCVSAQVTIQPKDEVFGGYSWLNPNGRVDFGYKVQSITKGFDVSNVYYLPTLHNVGVLLDGSGHFGSSSNAQVGYILGGLQYKFHTNTFSPFARIFVGTSYINPPLSKAEWNAALGAGGGFDLNIGHKFAIRLAQVDYIYTNYSPKFSGFQSPQWNSIRLAAGVVVNLGSWYNPPLSCAATATPAEVFAPDPVQVTTTGSNFPPKHTLFYSWTASGGKLSPDNAQSATIDTTDMAPGSYSAKSTITDPKLKNHDSGTHSFLGRPEPMAPAMCAANYTIKQPLPPVVSCSASPTTIAIGESSTVTMTATDPQGWPMTYSWTNSGGTLSGSGTSATVTATSADAGNTITVTGTATTNRPGGNPATLSSSCTASVTVPPVQTCTNIEDWGECTFEKNPKKPWRVDNDCKDTLDKLSLRLQQMPNGKLDIVGYTDEKEVVSEQTLGAQRSVNVKYYLTTDGPNKVDAGRIQPRQGGTKGKATHFYFVPEGNMCGGQLEEGTTVDETAVQPQSRNAPAPKKKAHKAKPAAAPAQ
jgi:outer membrane protein OmpA-like peptidoglycan-associated protein